MDSKNLTLPKKIFLIFISGLLCFQCLTPVKKPDALIWEFLFVTFQIFLNKDNQQDENKQWLSMQESMFMPIFFKKINNGNHMFNFFTKDKDEALRNKVNTDILTEKADKNYSLYDRFGGNLYFSTYVGEKTTEISVIDKIYTKIVTNDHDPFNWHGENFWELISTEPNQFTHTFYQNRPVLKTLLTDPRVLKYILGGNGINILDVATLGAGNYKFNTAKAITSISCDFIDNTIVNSIFDTLKHFLESSVWQNIVKVVDVLLVLAIMTFIGFLIKDAIMILRGRKSLRELIVSFCCTLLTIGLIVALSHSPTKFCDITRKAMSFGENAISNVLNMEKTDDWIVNSDINDNVMKATLWETAIFNHWVKSQFGVTKDELYTTYDTEHPDNHWEVKKEAAEAYGDIEVSRGKDKTVKNWAALAYSTHSIYHLPAIKDEKIQLPDNWEKDPGFSQAWPKAEMPSGGTHSVYYDDFRVADANLKVGQFESDDKKVQEAVSTPYYGWRIWSGDYAVQSWGAIWCSLLLLPLAFLGIKKLLSVLECCANVIILLGRSMLFIFLPNNQSYGFFMNLKAAVMPIIKYTWYIIIIFIGITLYDNMVASGNFLLQLLYLVFVIYLCTLKPPTPSRLKETLQKIKNKIKGFGGKVKNMSLPSAANAPDSMKQMDLKSRHKREAKESQAQKRKEMAEDDKKDIDEKLNEDVKDSDKILFGDEKQLAEFMKKPKNFKWWASMGSAINKSRAYGRGMQELNNPAIKNYCSTSGSIMPDEYVDACRREYERGRKSRENYPLKEFIDAYDGTVSRQDNYSKGCFIAKWKDRLIGLEPPSVAGQMIKIPDTTSRKSDKKYQKNKEKIDNKYDPLIADVDNQINQLKDSVGKGFKGDKNDPNYENKKEAFVKDKLKDNKAMDKLKDKKSDLIAQKTGVSDLNDIGKAADDASRVANMVGNKQKKYLSYKIIIKIVLFCAAAYTVGEFVYVIIGG